MGKVVDLTDQEFGFWTVLGLDSMTRHGAKFLAKCLCGTVRSVLAKSLKEGKSTSCGCRQKLPTSVASRNSLFRNYRRGAIKRGLSFSLSKEVFQRLTSDLCHYCQAPPSASHDNKQRWYNGKYVYNGIDRKDSSKGYEEDNCVPCCWTCNRMKQSMGLDAFIRHCHRVAAVNPLSKQVSESKTGPI